MLPTPKVQARIALETKQCQKPDLNRWYEDLAAPGVGTNRKWSDCFYLSQDHDRYAWITLALEHLPVQDVSYLARVSTDVIYKHCAGCPRKMHIPEL